MDSDYALAHACVCLAQVCGHTNAKTRHPGQLTLDDNCRLQFQSELPASHPLVQVNTGNRSKNRASIEILHTGRSTIQTLETMNILNLIGSTGSWQIPPPKSHIQGEAQIRDKSLKNEREQW